MNSALYIGATGMKGLGAGMNVITHNLANVSTIGYKEQDVQFSDLIYPEQGGIGRWWGAQENSYVAIGQAGKGVRVDTVRTLFGQGALESSNTVTDLAIAGKGFFQVTDGTRTYYTRAGDFRNDKEGVFRTPQGMALNGYRLQPDGSPGGLEPVTVPRYSPMPAKATSSLDMRLNLGLDTQHSLDPANPYFSLLEQFNATGTPPLAPSAYGYAQGINLYDSGGNARTATIYFDAAPDATPGSTAQYLIALAPEKEGTSAQALMAGTLSFNVQGQLTSMSAFVPSAGDSLLPADWIPATLSADGLPQMEAMGSTVSVNLGIRALGGWVNAPANAGAVGTDQSLLPGMGTNAERSADATANHTGAPTLRYGMQDGYPEGILSRIHIHTDGIVTGFYSNNRSMDLWQIPLCRFTSDDGLRREGDNLFSATPAAGVMGMGTPGTENYGTVRSYNIEQSNVDMAAEMVDMIITQRGFQSNSKVVTTADQMLQRAVELKRS